MDYKLNLITPCVYSKPGNSNCLDPLAEEFAEYVKVRADEIGLPCKYNKSPGLAFIHRFEDFEERFLIHSEYAVIIGTPQSKKSLNQFLPRLLVFLSIKSIWQNRFLIVLLGDVDVLDNLVVHPPIRFSLNDWRTGDDESWIKLFGLVKVKWVPYEELISKSEPISDGKNSKKNKKSQGDISSDSFDSAVNSNNNNNDKQDYPNKSEIPDDQQVELQTSKNISEKLLIETKESSLESKNPDQTLKTLNEDQASIDKEILKIQLTETNQISKETNQSSSKSNQISEQNQDANQTSSEIIQSNKDSSPMTRIDRSNDQTNFVSNDTNELNLKSNTDSQNSKNILKDGYQTSEFDNQLSTENMLSKYDKQSSKDTNLSDKDGDQSSKDTMKSESSDQSPKDADKSSKIIDQLSNENILLPKYDNQLTTTANQLVKDGDQSSKNDDTSSKIDKKLFKDTNQSDKNSDQSPKDTMKSESSDQSPKDADKSKINDQLSNENILLPKYDNQVTTTANQLVKDGDQSSKNDDTSSKIDKKLSKDTNQSDKNSDQSSKDAIKSESSDQSPKDADKSKINDQLSNENILLPKYDNQLTTTANQLVKDGDQSSKDDDKSSKIDKQSSKDTNQSDKNSDQSSKDTIKSESSDQSPKDADKSSKINDQLAKTAYQLAKDGDQSSKDDDRSSKSDNQSYIKNKLNTDQLVKDGDQSFKDDDASSKSEIQSPKESKQSFENPANQNVQSTKISEFIKSSDIAYQTSDDSSKKHDIKHIDEEYKNENLQEQDAKESGNNFINNLDNFSDTDFKINCKHEELVTNTSAQLQSQPNFNFDESNNTPTTNAQILFDKDTANQEPENKSMKEDETVHEIDVETKFKKSDSVIEQFFEPFSVPKSAASNDLKSEDSFDLIPTPQNSPKSLNNDEQIVSKPSSQHDNSDNLSGSPYEVISAAQHWLYEYFTEFNRKVQYLITTVLQYRSQEVSLSGDNPQHVKVTSYRDNFIYFMHHPFGGFLIILTGTLLSPYVYGLIRKVPMIFRFNTINPFMKFLSRSVTHEDHMYSRFDIP